jgi:hypothetical protein
MSARSSDHGRIFHLFSTTNTMTSTSTLLRRALLSAACLLPLAVHAQTANRQAGVAPTPGVAAKPCYSCPPPTGLCDFTITGQQWNGGYAPLSEYQQVCQFNYVYLDVTMNFGNASTYSWQVIAPTTNAVTNTSSTTGSTYSFQVVQPTSSTAAVAYTIRCTVPCLDGDIGYKGFDFYAIPRNQQCGRSAARPGSALPVDAATLTPLAVYLSPANETVAISLVTKTDGTTVVFNDSGKPVKHVTLHDGKKTMSSGAGSNASS